MKRHLTLKPDFAKTIERFDAWWTGELIDRPPVTIHTPNVRPVDAPPANHATLRDRWLDVDYQVESALAGLRARDWLGDAIPCWAPNVGPELTSTPFGCELEFGQTTSWSRPIIESVEQWQRVIETEPNFDNPYWQMVDRATDLAIDRFGDAALVGLADLHGNMDILAGLREPMDLCMDLADDPQLVRRALMHATRALTEGFARQHETLRAAGIGSTCWTPFYHEGPAYIPSSDFWCMVSGEQARDLILPAIAAEMAALERSIFHLDGPQALRHLDLLLEMPDLNAVQWVYGAGNGPASRWVDVYRRCLAAGKSVQIMTESVDDALACVEAVGVRGVWLCPVNCDSAEQAKALLKELDRLAAKLG